MACLSIRSFIEVRIKADLVTARTESNCAAARQYGHLGDIARSVEARLPD